ncbi:U1 snRNP protein, partial [Teratosphaeriaceae sp. CCFEE 6253]
PPVDPAAVDRSWAEAHDANGKPYYYNSITKQTEWDPPEAYLRHKQGAQPDSGYVAGNSFGGARDDYRPRDRQIERRDEWRDHLPQKPSFDGGRDRDGGGKPWERRQDAGGFRGPMPEKTDEPEYATLEQAEEAFFALLRKHSITPDTTWEDCLRQVIRDREYRSLKDPK